MQSYRCKCGNLLASTSMGVAACTRCGKCGSNLAQGPKLHADPEPHEWVTKYDQNTGAPYERCSKCHETFKQLALSNRADTPWKPLELPPPEIPESKP